MASKAKTNGSSPYYVAVRDFERRLLRETRGVFNNNDREAAAALGITAEYFRLRSLHLGGVYEGQPRREPPGSMTTIRATLRDQGFNIPKKKDRKNAKRDGEHSPGGVSGTTASEDESRRGSGTAARATEAGEDPSE